MSGKCVKGFEVMVLQSAAGYYIGTIDEYEPNCRLSVQYYKEKQKAQEALDNRTFIERDCMENNFCNGSHRKCVI